MRIVLLCIIKEEKNIAKVGHSMCTKVNRKREKNGPKIHTEVAKKGEGSYVVVAKPDATIERLWEEVEMNVKGKKGT